MAQKEFSLLEALDVSLGGVVYKIRPSADDMRRMGQFRMAVEAVGRMGLKGPERDAAIRARMNPEDYDLLDDNEALTRIELGAAAYEQMSADGIPLPTILSVAQYSFNYHIGGEAFADRVLTIKASADEPATNDETDAAFPKPSKSGRSTASGSQTKTASTAGTGASRRTSGKSSTTKRKK